MGGLRTERKKVEVSFRGVGDVTGGKWGESGSEVMAYGGRWDHARGSWIVGTGEER